MPDRPIDLDLRKVRYFVAVAERRHFGRAALALHVTQPALSRQVRQLEHELRVELFTRSTRDVTLTPAGEQFLHDAKALLAAAEAAQDRARRISAGDDALIVGFMLGTDVTLALNAPTRPRPGPPSGTPTRAPTAPGPATAPPSTTWRNSSGTSGPGAASRSYRPPSRPRSPGPTSRTSRSPTYRRGRWPWPGTARRSQRVARFVETVHAAARARETT